MVDSQDLRIYSHKSKDNDNFYVQFLGMTENMNETLSKQLRSITRPSMITQEFPTSSRRFRYQNPGRVEFGEVKATFKDDEDSVTSCLLYVQFMKQLYRHEQSIEKEHSPHNGRFDACIEIKNSKGQTMETMTLKNAFFSRVDFGELDYEQEEELTMTVNIKFDNIQFSVSPAMQEYDEFFDDQDVFTV